MSTVTTIGSGDGEQATLGFLHTASSHVEAFGALLRRLDPTATGAHAVREELLARARVAEAHAPGPIPRVTTERDAVRAVVTESVTDLASRCRVVLVTCSTLGPYVDALPPVVIGGRTVPLVRVDRPVARLAVAVARERAASAAVEGRLRWPSATPYVVVVAALSSAAAAIRALLADCAAGDGDEIAIDVTGPPDAWPLFEAGDLAGYLAAVDRSVATCARTQLPDAIVLAQASMATLADPTGSRYGVPVLASPELAVAEALRLAADP